MAKFDKPANLNTIWASTALSQNSVYPSASYAEEGWLQVKPPFEYENAINYKHDQMLAHINQLGVVEWDSSTEYQAGKSYVQGSNNLIYKCIQTNVNKNPATAGNGNYWEVFEGNRQATTLNRGTVKLATLSSVNSGNNNSDAITPTTLKSNRQSIWSNSSLQENGYQIFPSNGSYSYIRQWGSEIIQGNTTGTIVLPRRMDSLDDIFCLQVSDNGVSNASLGVYPVNNVRIAVNNSGVDTRVYWSLDGRVSNNI